MGAPKSRTLVERMVELSDKGRSFKQIGQELEVHPDTVAKYIKDERKDRAIRQTPAASITAKQIDVLLRMADAWVAAEDQSAASRSRKATLDRVAAERERFGDVGPLTLADTIAVRKLLKDFENQETWRLQPMETGLVRELLARKHDGLYGRTQCLCGQDLFVAVGVRTASCFTCGRSKSINWQR